MADGLFANPEDLQRARLIQQAQMTPNQRLFMMTAQGGQQLGKGVGSLFGVDVQDPAMARASKLRELGAKYGTTTAEALDKIAAELQQTDPQMAMQVAEKANAMRLQSNKIASEAALTQQRMRERALADPYQKLLESGKYEPESVEEYKQTGKGLKLVDKTKPVKTSITTADGKRVLVNDETGEIIKVLGTAGKSLEESLGAGLGMLGKALAAGQKKEAEETGQFAAKDFNALGSAVASGTASKRNIQVLESAMKNAFTGKFSDVKEGVVTGLKGLGIDVGPDLTQAATNTQLVNAMGTRYVFPLVKNFPGSLAAKELDRLEKTAPNSLQQPETINTLLNLLKQDLAENEFTYKKAKQYKDTNKGSTIGFNQADSRIEYQNKLTSLRSKVQAARKAGSMTAAQRDEINALKEELGVE